NRSRSRRRSPPQSRRRESSPHYSEEERDRRTVFVTQLANRLTTHELREFFEQAGAVRDAQIVRDRVTGRSKGVAYVEFRREDSVQVALTLSGKRILGIPVIVQLTEAEKNRKARELSEQNRALSAELPFHRLCVGNIHFNITDEDLKAIFEPFGELEYVRLQRDDQNRSKGFGFIQFRDPLCARIALEKMNGFDLAGRQLRVGLGTDKFATETTASMLRRFDSSYSRYKHEHVSQPTPSISASSDEASHQRLVKSSDNLDEGNLSPSEDSRPAISRDELMKKLARNEQIVSTDDSLSKPPTRCVLLQNMFNPEEETGDHWMEELALDVREECEEKYGHVAHLQVVPSDKVRFS
ncbi:RNA-binding protein Rsd1, partial [Schizosaccharomyces japonicus yFS275]